MNAFGYNVKGDSIIIKDISKIMKNKSCKINWNICNTGDIYWTDNGDRYRIEIDHGKKEVILVEW